MCMRITVISGMCAAFLNIGAATAMPEDMTVDRLLAICEAPDVQAATVKGEELGWKRLTDAETEEWRNNFVTYNGGSVEVVGWRRERQATPICCRSGLPSVQTATKHVPIRRRGPPDCWMPYRGVWVSPTFSTGMTRRKSYRLRGRAGRSYTPSPK